MSDYEFEQANAKVVRHLLHASRATTLCQTTQKPRHTSTNDRSFDEPTSKGLGTIYTQSDYNAWRTHFGPSGGGGAGASVNNACLNQQRSCC
jgi:hypothetical protein